MTYGALCTVYYVGQMSPSNVKIVFSILNTTGNITYLDIKFEIKNIKRQIDVHYSVDICTLHLQSGANSNIIWPQPLTDSVESVSLFHGKVLRISLLHVLGKGAHQHLPAEQNIYQ